MEFLVPWHEAGSSAARFERELESEVGERHPLNAKRMRAIAMRQDCDDVLFVSADEPPLVAVVHLTYANRPELNPQWPKAVFYQSLQDWADRGMRADHEHFCS